MEAVRTAQILVRVPAELRRAFRMKMIEEGRSMRDCLQEFIESQVKDYEPKIHR